MLQFLSPFPWQFRRAGLPSLPAPLLLSPFPFSPQCGDSVVVVPTIPDEEAKKLFPKGVFTKDLPSGKKYLRYTPQPE